MMQIPPWMTKNYVILAPVATHWRPATCEEVACNRFTHGFDVWCDESDDSPAGGAARARYLRSGVHGRRFEEYRAPGQSMVVFKFPPGQVAFGDEHQNHRIRIERPEIFTVRDPVRGDLVHDGAEGGAVNWVDDFATNQDQVKTSIERLG
jgi:hypothetical protein